MMKLTSVKGIPKKYGENTDDFVQSVIDEIEKLDTDINDI